MAKAIFVLAFALVLLGFLISTTINMSSEMEQLKAENQQLSQDLVQMQQTHDSLIRENDAFKSENVTLNQKLNALQDAYVSEHQARLRAETESASYKALISSMAGAQTATSESCESAILQGADSGKLNISSLAPVGAGSIITLIIAGLLVLAPKDRQNGR